MDAAFFRFGGNIHISATEITGPSAMPQIRPSRELRLNTAASRSGTSPKQQIQIRAACPSFSVY